MNGVKITKSQLKSIVKECLVEILQEGLGASGPILATSSNNNSNSFLENRQRKTVEQKQMSRPKSSFLDTPLKRSAMSETIMRESQGNPLMADIFADTAKNTLPKMLSNDKSGHGSSKAIQVEHFEGTPEEVFGEDVASKWANLAFMNTPSKKLAQ
jgi:hypothetical protein